MSVSVCVCVCEMGKLSLDLPPGFRFSPTDKELIERFLKRKITGNDKDIYFVPEIEFYKLEPWDIQRNLLIFIITHPPSFWILCTLLSKVGICFFFFFLLLVCHCWNSVVNCCLLWNFYFILFYMVNCIRLINQNKWLQRSYGSYLNLHGPTTFGLLFTLNKL